MSTQRFFWPAFAALILAVIAGFLWWVVIPQLDLISDTRVSGPDSIRSVASDVVIPSGDRVVAPAFRIRTASFGDDRVFDLASVDGDVVVLFFMASRCTTCVPEARTLDATIMIDRDGRVAYRDAFPTGYERLDDAIRGLI